MSEPQVESDNEGLTITLLLVLVLLLVVGGGAAVFFGYRARTARMMALEQELLAERDAQQRAQEAAGAEGTRRSDWAEFQGNWKAEFQVPPHDAGVEIPGNSDPHDHQVEIHEDRWRSMERSGGPEQAGRDWRLKLDPSATPKAIDLLDPQGEVQKHGIYEFTGGALRVCLAAKDKARPTEFRSDAQKGWALYLLRRQKR
jgi:uncharacterized protein (TIGR03067 family)